MDSSTRWVVVFGLNVLTATFIKIYDTVRSEVDAMKKKNSEKENEHPERKGEKLEFRVLTDNPLLYENLVRKRLI